MSQVHSSPKDFLMLHELVSDTLMGFSYTLLLHRNSQLCGLLVKCRHNIKSVESDYCRSTDRGSRIAFLIKRQREAHAEYKYSPCHIVKVRVCAYAYTQMLYLNRHKRDNLYPVGHLSLLSSYQVEICEISISQNRALINAF